MTQYSDEIQAIQKFSKIIPLIEKDLSTDIPLNEFLDTYAIEEDQLQINGGLFLNIDEVREYLAGDMEEDEIDEYIEGNLYYISVITDENSEPILELNSQYETLYYSNMFSDIQSIVSALEDSRMFRRVIEIDICKAKDEVKRIIDSIELKENLTKTLNTTKTTEEHKKSMKL